MGAFNRNKPPATIKPKDAAEAKSWGWEEYESIQIKTQTTTADMDAIAYGEAQGRQIQAMCQVMIVDWNLLGGDGMKVPVTPQTIAELPPEYSMRVMMESTKYLNAGVSVEEAQSFLTSVTAPTPGI